MKKILLLLSVGIIITSCNYSKNDVIVYQAPEGEELGTKFKVSANGVDVPVYMARICKEHIQGRHQAGIAAQADTAYDITNFVSFDMKKNPVRITVTAKELIASAKILPTSFGIIPKIKDNTLTFEVDKPQNITVEINGDHIRSLHVFVNPEETDIPDPNDPNVIYFGPGIHEITQVNVTDNQTVYLAGGAVVRGILEEDAEGQPRHTGDSFVLKGKNITFRGRGILDHGLIPRVMGRQTMSVTVDNFKLEGVVLCNSSGWTVAMRNCNNVHIDNLKLFGHRANSDGLDITACIDVLVENCFLRTWDDLVVVKTLRGVTQDARNIHVRKCVLYNELAHALSIGAELTRDVENVLFEDCDVIGDHGREWTLRIYHTDAATIKNVRFENIRIEESVRFASLWINKANWSTDSVRGKIEDVTFRNITVNNNGYQLHRDFEFLGFDENSAIRNVLIDNVVINGRKVTQEDINLNPPVGSNPYREGIAVNDFVYNVTVK
jgi:polygalacturonase